MERALALARRGWGRVAPNPLVGAVLLREGEVIGEGYHAEYGESHAEVAALGDCPDATGATMVVSLEPCNHAGKTPPCTDAILQAGVSRVVLPLRDPTPEAGGGAHELREAGVEVDEGLMREEAAAKWISGAEAREYVHWLRAGFDGIAVGRRTVELDDPMLTVRGSVEPRVPPARVLLTKSGMVRRDSRVVRTAQEVPTVVMTGSHTYERTVNDLDGTGVMVLAADGVEQVVTELRGAGMRSVLVEGGGSLAGALLEAHMVDRIYWIQAPLWLGVGVPAFGDRGGLPLEDSVRWVVTERRGLGPDTLLVVDRELCLPES
jgi:diaminohydroxyphosphoribosylaminopyrimidine deaminase/5-amino-6-(5-phosphoribosylamino)uracil reductase